MIPSKPLRRPALICAVLVMAVLGGCTKAPDLPTGRHLVASGTFPEIKPIDAVLASSGDPALDPADPAALQARAAALTARAATLTTITPDAETRARLDAALAAKGS